MTPSIQRIRGRVRSAAVPAAAGIVALAVAPSAFGAASTRHIGGPGTGLQPTTVAPDLRSVAIDPTNDLGDGIGERARFCFDQSLNTVGGGFILQSYDSTRSWQGTGARATDDDKCAIATFPKGSDISQATIGSVNAGAVTDVSNRKNIVASEPAQNSAARPRLGATTGPDLIDVQVDTSDAAHKVVKFIFDENLNPSPTRPDGPDADTDPENAYQRQDFLYARADGAPVAAAVGNVSPGTGAAANSVTVDFGAAPIEEAVRFITQPNAVEDRPQTNALPGVSLVTPSSPGVVVKNATTGGRPDLVSAQSVGGNAYLLTYNTAITTGAGTAGRIQAIGDDGSVSAVAVSAGTGGSATTVLAQFPDSSVLTKDPGSIVRIISGDNAVVNSTDSTKGSIYAQANTGVTPSDTAGFTNGPDLVSVGVDPATQRAVFNYDEPVAPSNPASAFVGFRADTTSEAGTGGTASSGNSIVATMGAGIADFVAYGQGYNAIQDAAGHPNPAQSVSKDLQPVSAPGTGGGTTPPVTGASKRKKVKTGYSSFKRKSARYSGRLSAAAKTCKYKRRVILRKVGKGTKRYGQAFTRSDGTFTIKRKSRVGGRVYVVVTEKTTSTTQCSSRTSKKIRG